MKSLNCTYFWIFLVKIRYRDRQRSGRTSLVESNIFIRHVYSMARFSWMVAFVLLSFSPKDACIPVSYWIFQFYITSINYELHFIKILWIAFDYFCPCVFRISIGCHFTWSFLLAFHRDSSLLLYLHLNQCFLGFYIIHFHKKRLSLHTTARAR